MAIQLNQFIFCGGSAKRKGNKVDLKWRLFHRFHRIYVRFYGRHKRCLRFCIKTRTPSQGAYGGES